MYNIFLDYNISVSRIKFKKFNKIVQNIIIWYNSMLDVVSSAREPAHKLDRAGSRASSSWAEPSRARAKFPPLFSTLGEQHLWLDSLTQSISRDKKTLCKRTDQPQIDWLLKPSSREENKFNET
jgi:hypothetical protein